MRKEQVVAVVLGTLIGVGIAFGLWHFSRQKEATFEPSNSSPESQKQSVESQGFSIVAPADNSVVATESAKITGFAPPGSLIMASAENTEVALTGADGEFELEISLAPGINNVSVWAFWGNEAQEESELTLIYSSELEGDVSLSAILGTVTDISEDSLQVRTHDGTIEQLSISPDTTYAQVDGTEEVEFSDLAIGDFIAALGTKEESLMHVGRVLVTPEPEAPSTTVVTGTINILTSRDFRIKSESGEISIDATGGVDTYSYTPEGLSSTRLSAAEEGGLIVVVGSYEGDEFVADTIILM